MTAASRGPASAAASVAAAEAAEATAATTLMACPVCGMVGGLHDNRLHKEAEKEAKEQGRPPPPKK